MEVSTGLDGALHRRKETPQLRLIQFAVGSYAGAEVKPEWPDLPNRLRNIFWRESSCEKKGDVDIFANCPAQRPVMRLAGTAQFFDCEPLIS